MDHSTNEFYSRYVRAVEFFNAEVDRKFGDASTRAIFRTKVLPQEEFRRWWAEVSHDHELQARWLERFEDPAGSFERNCERIKKELDQIPIRRVAA